MSREWPRAAVARARLVDQTVRPLLRTWRGRIAYRLLLRRGGLAIVLGVALLVLLLNCATFVISIQTIRDRDGWVTHSNEVLAQLSALDADSSGAAASARGYVISGNSAYVATFAQTSAAISTELTQLRALTSDNPIQQQRLTKLQPMITSRLRVWQQAITLRQANQTPQALQLVAASSGNPPSITIQDQIRPMVATEQRLLVSRDASATTAFRRAGVAFGVAVLIDLAMIGVVVLLVREGLRLRAQIALKQAQAEAHAEVLALEAANQRMNEFVSIAGHELRTPLTSAKINIGMTQRRLAHLLATSENTGVAAHEIARLQALITSTERQLGRQERLVADLLDLSRIQAGRLAFRMARCDLAAAVAETVHEQQMVHPDRVITLTTTEDTQARAAGMCSELVCDAERIGQVVANFITNALKFSPPAAPVVVTVSQAPQEARVSVRDQGPGLAPDEQARVWERFYQSPSVTVRTGSGIGLGLGLYISREIVERHGGQIGVESAPGAGSTFWFTLPRQQPPLDQ